MEHIWGYDGNVLDENGNPTFDTEAVKSGISSMKKILDEGVAIDGILGMMSKDVKAAFFAGQVLYIRDWSVALAAANDPEQSSVAGNVKWHSLPQVQTEMSSTTAMAVGTLVFLLIPLIRKKPSSWLSTGQAMMQC